ncbi:hypothetical protein CUZ96_2571 [Enterococcus lactis]|nr:hypothetical protein [Enterococcus lactis]
MVASNSSNLMGKGDRMDSFKTKVGFSKVYRITPANYEKQTKKEDRTY